MVEGGAHEIVSEADKMNLYSRQIESFGLELMGKLVQMRVLIVGMTGVGVETAKNLILAGPKAVVIHDDEPTRIQDLGTNFYLHEADIGKPRAKACVSQLATLNPYVEVSVHQGPLNESVWKNFSAIAYCSKAPLEELISCNEFCHKSSPARMFICASNLGVTSSIFTDFGPLHRITDPNGEPTKVNVVESISESGLVTVASERHGLDDGDFVRFDEVLGMTELNTLHDPIPIKRVFRKNAKGGSVIVLNQFQLDLDCSKFGKYETGGVVSQVHVAKEVSFRPLSESIINPIMEGNFSLHHMDMEKLLVKNRGVQLHFARHAIWVFQRLHGHLPRVHHFDDANKCVEIAKNLLKESQARATSNPLTVDAIEEDLVKTVALFAECELSGFCAFLGGIVAQEIVKVPGKFTPIRQWLHHDADELVEGGVKPDSSSIGSRYDWQINIFGKSFQEKLFKQKWFLVGAGALGCEYIKGIALMGLGAKGGMIYMTDMDRIEVSNLNRQFLFRRENVGQPKSVCAAAAAKRMNPDLSVHCFEVPVGPDTEDKFDDEFWSSLDGVWNALDNIKARKYTDSKCVFFEKPLLESGTLGTKANSEIILPNATTCYSDHKEAEEDSIPMCTLRNFPHFIEHCIEWARAQFTELFADSAQDFNSAVKDLEAFFSQVEKEGSASAQLEKLTATKDILELVKNGVTFENCIDLALKEFTKQYRDRILNLIHLFPEDARKTDKESGADLGLFWSGEKRFPQGAIFDCENEVHLDYVLNTANLFAYMFNLPAQRDRGIIQVISSKLASAIPEWKPVDGLKIQLDENEEKKSDPEDADEEKLDALKGFFRSQDLSKLQQLQIADFEKDDDTNFHIDYITAASNLRAWNYRIKPATRHKCKVIAGKIIPALATTTAMITGLVELELYKVVLGLSMTKFKNSNVNLAVNRFEAFEPIAPKKEKAEMDLVMGVEIKPVPDGFTVWDKIIVRKGDLTIEQFITALSEVHHGVKLSLLFKYGISQEMIDKGLAKPLYNSNPYLPKTMKEKEAAKFKRNLREVFVETYGPLPSPKTSYLILDGEVIDKDGDTVKIPRIVYYFK